MESLVLEPQDIPNTIQYKSESFPFLILSFVVFLEDASQH